MLKELYYSFLRTWLYRKHRILVSQVPRTSGKHRWEIWIWNREKVLWEEHVPKEIIPNTEASAVKEALSLI